MVAIIKIKFLEKASKIYDLKRATDGSAGFDLVAVTKNNILIKPSESKLINCGISIEMPKNFEAQVRPRSGLALKNMVTVLNAPGTIDSDYRGEICVILINHSSETFIVERGMRIAQIVFLELPPLKLVKVNKLNESERGEGGFGSTGLKKN